MPGSKSALASSIAHDAHNIIAVGASDHVGTATVSDDKPATFSNYVNGARRPDLMAPGVRVLGLNSPGSYLASAYPAAVQGEGGRGASPTAPARRRCRRAATASV